MLFNPASRQASLRTDSSKVAFYLYFSLLICAVRLSSARLVQYTALKRTSALPAWCLSLEWVGICINRWLMETDIDGVSNVLLRGIRCAQTRVRTNKASKQVWIDNSKTPFIERSYAWSCTNKRGITADTKISNEKKSTLYALHAWIQVTVYCHKWHFTVTRDILQWQVAFYCHKWKLYCHK
jgi:hypothetical protein